MNFGYVTENEVNSNVVVYEQQHLYLHFFTQEETYHDV